MNWELVLGMGMGIGYGILSNYLIIKSFCVKVHA